MVRGLEIFRDYFREFSDNYVLIGGTACSVTFDRAGETFRATKDLDIVLYVENLTDEFVRTIWSFIKDGGYNNRQTSTGKRLFYRFDRPADKRFPYMMELFAREPDVLKIPKDFHLTPIPTGEELPSLSAILLDETYYRLIIEGKQKIDELSVLHESYILILKAKAWLTLNDLQKSGTRIRSTDIEKHRRDVFRIFRILDPDLRVELPELIKKDLSTFMEYVMLMQPDLSTLGLSGVSLDNIHDQIEKMYNLG